MPRPKNLSKEQLDYLEANAGRVPIKKLALALGVCERAIYFRLRKLKVGGTRKEQTVLLAARRSRRDAIIAEYAERAALGQELFPWSTTHPMELDECSSNSSVETTTPS